MEMTTTLIEIRKPLYTTTAGCVVGVYDRLIHKAIQERQFVLVRSGQYEAQYLPKWVKKNCKKIKATFLRPNEPMTLYEIFLPKPKTAKEKKEDKWRELSLSL